MSPSDADARVLEQFLKTMAPPAALTAVYRQRVVRASLEARTKVLLRRQKQMVLLVCICVSFLFLLPGMLLTLSMRTFFSQNASEWLAADTLSPPPSAPHLAVDSYELSAMDAQWLSRLQNLLVARRAAEQ